MSLIFISHAAADKPVIDDFYDLLQTGCNLRREEIFCSSVDGAGIKTGEDFVRWIKRKLKKSKLVVLFLTPNYYASRFCVAEMGAAWALEHDVFPLVIPGIERDPGSVMLGRQTAVVDESGLDHLRDRIAKHHRSASEETPRWSLKKEQFLKKFREQISKLPKPPLIHRELLENEKERTAEAMEMYEELEEETRRLREQVGLLEKVKDAEEVKEIRKKFEPEEEQYEKLVKAVIKQLEELTRVEVRCVYASISGEGWEPSSETRQAWDKDIERALNSKRIINVVIERGLTDISAYEANRDHPKMKSVFKAIEELDNFITEDLSRKTKTRMQEEKRYYIEIENQEYWEEELEQRYLLD